MDNGLKYSVAIIFVVAFFALVAVMAMAFHDYKDTWLNFAAKIIAMLVISVVVLFALTGCSAPPPAATQPRALGIGNMQPLCLIFCFQTNNQTDAEAGATQTTSSTSSQSATVDAGVKP